MTKTAIMREIQNRINGARLKKQNVLMKVKEEKDKMKAREMFLYVEMLDKYIDALRKVKKFIQVEADTTFSRIFILVETQEEMAKLEKEYDGFYVTFTEEHVTPYSTVDLFDKFDWKKGASVYEYYVQIEPVPVQVN